MSGLRVAIRGRSFGDKSVLGEIGFDLEPGERLALLGPSGIGKSTLLGIIAGTDTGFEGTVTRPDGRIAVVFQTPRLLPWRTLAENIAVVPGAGDLDRARSLLAEVGLGEACDMHPERVSLGMQRRAALVRALAVDPALLLLDEPLVSLDPQSVGAMRDLLTFAMDRTGATVVMATHDRREALALTDRIVELGGTPARLVSDRKSPLGRDARRDPRQVDDVYREWFEPDSFEPGGGAAA